MKATMFVRVLPLTVLLLLPASAFAQTESNQNFNPAQLVDALNAVFGKQTDNRAVHAKGVAHAEP